MGRVEVRDYVLWTKQVHGDEALRDRLDQLEPGETVALRVDGREGLWRKMKANRTGGYKVPGLAPVGPAKARWGALYRENKPHGGTVVEVALAEGGPRDLEQRQPTPAFFWATDSLAEREAAWEGIKAMWAEGWRSTEPYGPRDELYDRDE